MSNLFRRILLNATSDMGLLRAFAMGIAESLFGRTKIDASTLHSWMQAQRSEAVDVARSFALLLAECRTTDVTPRSVVRNVPAWLWVLGETSHAPWGLRLLRAIHLSAIGFVPPSPATLFAWLRPAKV